MTTAQFLSRVLVVSHSSLRWRGEADTDVLYVPDLCKNLLFVSQMAKHKMSVLFENETVVVRSKDTGNSVSQGAEEHGLDRLCPLLV